VQAVATVSRQRVRGDSFEQISKRDDNTSLTIY
jgi:hypothetical protein